MTSAVSHLQSLASQDTAAGRWLARTLALWSSGVAWEVSSQTTRRGYRLARRDDHLRRVAVALDGDPAELARVAKRFESAIWPRWRDREQPPPDSGLLNTELFHAMKAAGRLPQSVRQYERIIRRISSK